MRRSARWCRKEPIRTPEDLEGKKIGVSTPVATHRSSRPTAVWPASSSTRSVVQVDSKILEQAAMSGVVDAILVTALSSVPNFVSEDVPFRMYLTRKSGLHFYSATRSSAATTWRRTKSSSTTFSCRHSRRDQVHAAQPAGSDGAAPEEHPELAIGKNGKLYVEPAWACRGPS